MGKSISALNIAALANSLYNSFLVFSLGFAATLVVVGVIAAQVGQKILGWMSGIWAVRVQIATTLFILGMGVVLTIKAISQIAAAST